VQNLSTHILTHFLLLVTKILTFLANMQISDEEMEAIDEMMRIFDRLDPTYGFRF